MGRSVYLSVCVTKRLSLSQLAYADRDKGHHIRGEPRPTGDDAARFEGRMLQANLDLIMPASAGLEASADATWLVVGATAVSVYVRHDPHITCARSAVFSLLFHQTKKIGMILDSSTERTKPSQSPPDAQPDRYHHSVYGGSWGAEGGALMYGGGGVS